MTGKGGNLVKKTLAFLMIMMGLLLSGCKKEQPDPSALGLNYDQYQLLIENAVGESPDRITKVQSFDDEERAVAVVFNLPGRSARVLVFSKMTFDSYRSQPKLNVGGESIAHKDFLLLQSKAEKTFEADAEKKQFNEIK